MVLDLFKKKNKQDTLPNELDNDIVDDFTQDRYDDSFDMDPPILEPDNIRYLQENQPEIFNFIMTISGKIRSKDGKYVSSGMKPMMNNRGVMDIYSMLNGVLVKIISLGSLRPDEANVRTNSTIKPFIMRLGANQTEYEVDKYHMSTIVLMLENLIYLHFTRAIGRGEANLLRGIYKVNENIKGDDAASDKLRAMRL